MGATKGALSTALGLPNVSIIVDLVWGHDQENVDWTPTSEKVALSLSLLFELIPDEVGRREAGTVKPALNIYRAQRQPKGASTKQLLNHQSKSVGVYERQTKVGMRRPFLVRILVRGKSGTSGAWRNAEQANGRRSCHRHRGHPSIQTASGPSGGQLVASCHAFCGICKAICSTLMFNSGSQRSAQYQRLTRPA